MFKKLIIAGVSLLVCSEVALGAETVAAQTSQVATQPSPAQEAAAKGAFVGAPATASAGAGGGATQQTSDASKRAYSSLYLGLGVSLLNVRGFTGLMPKAFLGYGTVVGECKDVYLGAEVFGGLGSIPLSRNQRHRVFSLIGASVQPGIMVRDWALLFARMGVESVRYSQLETTKNGILVGVGLQLYAYEHWDLRVEYDYNFNRNLNQYNVDFVYKFC
jgi:opacity protein-like surface antigen